MDSEFASALIKKAWVLQQTGEETQAAAILDRVHVSLQGDLNARAWLAHALALADEPARARAMLKELADPEQNKFVSPCLIACIYIALGEKESAWKWIDEAYRQRSGWLVWLGVDPKMDALRSDPRFAQLLKSMELSQENPE